MSTALPVRALAHVPRSVLPLFYPPAATPLRGVPDHHPYNSSAGGHVDDGRDAPSTNNDKFCLCRWLLWNCLCFVPSCPIRYAPSTHKSRARTTCALLLPCALRAICSTPLQPPPLGGCPATTPKYLSNLVLLGGSNARYPPKTLHRFQWSNLVDIGGSSPPNPSLVSSFVFYSHVRSVTHRATCCVFGKFTAGASWLVDLRFTLRAKLRNHRVK